MRLHLPIPVINTKDTTGTTILSYFRAVKYIDKSKRAAKRVYKTAKATSVTYLSKRRQSNDSSCTIQ